MQASVNTGEAVAALWRLCAIYGSGAIGRETALEYLHETGVVPHDRLRTNYLPLLSQYLLGGTLQCSRVTYGSSTRAHHPFSISAGSLYPLVNRTCPSTRYARGIHGDQARSESPFSVPNLAH